MLTEATDSAHVAYVKNIGTIAAGEECRYDAHCAPSTQCRRIVDTFKCLTEDMAEAECEERDMQYIDNSCQDPPPVCTNTWTDGSCKYQYTLYRGFAGGDSITVNFNGNNVDSIDHDGYPAECFEACDRDEACTNFKYDRGTCYFMGVHNNLTQVEDDIHTFVKEATFATETGSTPGFEAQVGEYCGPPNCAADLTCDSGIDVCVPSCDHWADLTCKRSTP